MRKLYVFLVCFLVLVLFEYGIYKLTSSIDRTDQSIASHLSKDTNISHSEPGRSSQGPELAVSTRKASTQPKSPKATPVSSPHVVRPKTKLAAILGIWEEESEQAGLKADIREKVKNIVREAVDRTGIKIIGGEIGADQFRDSFERFIDMHYRALNSQESGEKTCYWLAYCILEALVRPSFTEKEHKALLAHYAEVHGSLSAHIDSRFRRVLSEAHYEKWKPEIQGALDQLERILNLKVLALSKDVLCPAFRKPLTESKRKEVLEYLSIRRYPRYVEPKIQMLKEEEYYGKHLEEFFNLTLTVTMENMFMKPIAAVVGKNPYWGQTTYLAVNSKSGSYWPFYVGLEIERKAAPTPRKDSGDDIDDELF